MKIPIRCVLIFTLVLSSYTFAQESEPVPRISTNGFMTVGTALFNGTVPEGTNSRISLSFSLGALVEIPLSDGDWSIGSAASIDGRSMYFETEDDGDVNQRVIGFFLSLAQTIKWKVFFLSPVIGFPFLGYQTINPDPYIITTEQSPDPIGQMSSATVDADNFAMLIDVRFGALIPFSSSEDPWKILLTASLPITSFVKDYRVVSSDPSVTWGVITDSKLITLQAGVGYCF